MANEADIDAVVKILPYDASAAGWDRTYIGQRLDAGLNANQIAAEYWDSRAASTASYMNITESGSSRSMRDVHLNAVAMAKEYRSRTPEETGTTSRGRLGSIRMNRK